MCSFLDIPGFYPTQILTENQLLRLEALRLLVLSNQFCSKCSSLLHLEHREKAINKFILRCPSSRCRYERCITAASFFEHRHETIATILYILCLLELRVSFTATADLACISIDTVYRIYHDLAERMHRYNEHHAPKFINGDIVEMDETKIKWKDGELEGEWVIGAVDRDYQTCWLTVIEDRSTAAMEGPIRSVVKNGSIVMTDALNTYTNIMKRIGCTHEVINKAAEGLGRTDKRSGISVNVNKCECMWRYFRQLMEQRNMYDASTRHHLIAEFMYDFSQKSWIDLLLISMHNH